MIKEAIDKILSIGEPMTVQVAGKDYTNKALKQILTPLQETLVIGTLQGLIDYITSHSLTDFVVHIKSPTEVTLISKPDTDGRITMYAMAVFTPPTRNPGWQAMDEFIINAQAMFLDNADRARMLKIVGNLVDENIKTVADDGLTQRVTVKTGLAKVAEVDIGNPFLLAPYRTFPEVEQPTSNFILRIQNTHNLAAALFEVQDRLWILEVVGLIKAWLKEAYSDLSIIA